MFPRNIECFYNLLLSFPLAFRNVSPELNICLKNGGVPETCLTKPDEEKCQEYINWYENDAWENNNLNQCLKQL